jgi:hypothetical protein
MEREFERQPRWFVMVLIERAAPAEVVAESSASRVCSGVRSERERLLTCTSSSPLEGNPKESTLVSTKVSSRHAHHISEKHHRARSYRLVLMLHLWIDALLQ